MQFLSPLFWIGALAVAGPIILHLIRREKAELLPFASLMFLRKIPRKELQRQQLRYLFLLFLRCLGLLLMVATFARPVMTQRWANQMDLLPARSVLILVDRSMSMSHPATWDKALQSAEKKIKSLGDGDEGLIVQFGEGAEVLSQWESKREQLLHVMKNRVSPGFEATSYLEALRIAADQFKAAHNPKKEIYLITDLQRSALNVTLGWKVPAEIKVEVEDVGTQLSNVYIDDVRIEREAFTNQYPHPVLVRLGSSPSQPTPGEAQLYLEGKLIDRQSFELGQNGTAHLTFQPFDLEEGIVRGKIVVDPPDALPADNTFHFVVEKKAPRRVLIVSEAGRGSAFYLENALSSGENLPFQVQVAAPSALRNLNSKDTPVVVLDDLPQPPAFSIVEAYLKAGGGVIVALSSKARAEAYNTRWGEVLPVEIVDRNFVRTQQTPFTSMTDVNWQHPVFSIFQDVHKAAIVSAQFYGYWKLTSKPGAVLLARFSQGDAAVAEGRFGNGRVLVFASSLDSIWTDFPLRSAYVPFWRRMVQYAGGWEPVPPAMEVNQVIPLPQSGHWNVLDPKGQRVLAMDAEQPGFVSLKMPGHYEIRHQKKTDWVAANCQSVESDLTRISKEEFLAALVPRMAQTQVVTLQDSIREQEKQQSLWWLFLAAGMAVLGTESLLANGYYGSKPLR